MNGAQIHLLLNHLPVLFPLVSAGILLVGNVRKILIVQLVGCWVLLIGGLSAVPTFYSGQPAESVVKNYPNIQREDIEAHEAAALPALWFDVALALFAGAILLRSRRDRVLPASVWQALFVFNLIAFLLTARVAHLGGEIRHEEIQDFRE